MVFHRRNTLLQTRGWINGTRIYIFRSAIPLRSNCHNLSKCPMHDVTPATCLMRWTMLFSSSGVVTGLSAWSRCCCLRGLFRRLAVAVRNAFALGDCAWCSESSSGTLLNSSSAHVQCRQRKTHIHRFMQSITAVWIIIWTCCWKIVFLPIQSPHSPKYLKYSSSPLQKFLSMKPLTSPHGCFLKRSSADTLRTTHVTILKFSTL